MRPFLTAITLTLLASATAQAANPVCALLDSEKAPRVALLEAKLLADPSATWVDRADIDKVLQEQKLQGLFSPQAVGERVKLGKFLKADLLVMVRAVKGAKEPVLEVVVSETVGGLRLLRRAIPVTKNADEDVAALLSATRDGIKKYGEKVAEVVAVPPFVSNDLGYQFDHLKSAYAKLAEALALDRKGVVVVELEEAQALAKELALAAPGTPLAARPAPLFLLGEYRHEGKGKDRTVALKLKAERGGKTIGRPQTATHNPDAAPEAIRKWASSALDAAGTVAPPAPDARAEATRLAELGLVHKRLGNWSEALGLIEASLLLDPKQPERHADAMEVLTPWIDGLLTPAPLEVERVRRAVEAHRRGLDHLEQLVSSGVRLRRYIFEPGQRFTNRQFASRAVEPRPGPLPKEVAELVQPLRDEEREVYTRLALMMAKAADMRDEVYYARRVWRGYSGEDPGAGYARLEKILLAVQDRPGTTPRMRGHLFGGDNMPIGNPKLPYYVEYCKFLDRLEAAGNADLKMVVGEARKELARRVEAEKEIARRAGIEATAQARLAEARKTDPKAGQPYSVTDPDRLEARLKGGPFLHVRLTAEPKEPDVQFAGQVFLRLAHLSGIIPAGPGVDVLWGDGNLTDGTLYLMKEKGKLKRVYRIGGLGAKFRSVVFDGKYVWASGDGKNTPPFLIAIDPATEGVFTITEKHGLPAGKAPAVAGNRPSGYSIAALEPGRVCVIGSFGQTWVAVATFDRLKGATVKVIHEARDTQNPNDRDGWKKTTIAFTPAHVYPLRGEAGANGKIPVRVLIGRWGGPFIQQHPLVVDPDKETVEVLQTPIPGFPLFSACGSGRSVYAAPGMGKLAIEKIEPRLLRIDYPGVVRDLGPAPTATAHPLLHFNGDHLHVVRAQPDLFGWEALVPPKDRWWPGEPSEWLVADAKGKELQTRAANYHRVTVVGTSSHYGLVVLLGCGSETALCEVTLEPAKRP